MNRKLLWLPWMIIFLLLLTLVYTVHYVRSGIGKSQACEENLKRIYGALEYYDHNAGALPELHFYPNHPLISPNSLRRVLSQYGIRSEHCVCPAAHGTLQQRGLSYLWNPSLNNRPLDSFPTPEWMLVEIEAISDRLHGQHFRQFYVLYTDGTIHRTTQVPPGVRDPQLN